MTINLNGGFRESLFNEIFFLSSHGRCTLQFINIGHVSIIHIQIIFRKTMNVINEFL